MLVPVALIYYVIRRYLWFNMARKIYFNYVIHYCEKTKQDVNFLLSATSLKPFYYSFFYFWEKNLRFFAYYPELFDEVIQHINHMQMKIANDFLEFLEKKTEEYSKTPDEKK